jgi:hypothetical protein
MSGKAITPAPGKLMAPSVPMRPSDGGSKRDVDLAPPSGRTPATFVPTSGSPTPRAPLESSSNETPIPQTKTIPPPAKRSPDEGTTPVPSREDDA